MITVLWTKFLKNQEKPRTNQKQYTLKVIKVLRTGSLGSNFSGSYKKECNILLTRNLPIEFGVRR